MHHAASATEPLRVEVAGVSLEQPLYDLVALELIVGDAENLEGLLAGHEAALDSQALLRHLLTALVTKLLHRRLIGLLVKVLHDLLHSFFFCERADHTGGTLFRIGSYLAGSILSRSVNSGSVLSM